MVFTLMAAVAAGLWAQDLKVTVPDGPAPKADTLNGRPGGPERPAFFRFYRTPSRMATSPFSPYVPGPSPFSPYFLGHSPDLPSFLAPDQFGYETREELAARVDASTKARVMASIDQDLYWHRLPKLSRPAMLAYSLAGLFLSNPFGFREGYVPLMNPSFPFIDVYTPGMAPYELQYSSDFFPRAVDVEFDLSSGTYKQKTVDWTELQKNMARSFGGAYRYEPVPQIPVTPVERAMQQRH